MAALFLLLNGWAMTAQAQCDPGTDTEPPTFTYCPGDIFGGIYVDTDPGQCGATVTWAEPTATDNCDISPYVSRRYGPPSGSFFPVGYTTVHYDADDSQGNNSFCIFDVVVFDVGPPTFTVCPANIGPLALAPDGCTALANWTEPTADDNCSASISRSDATGLANGGAFPPGVTTIEYTATDPSNNTALCSFKVTVEGETENPAIPDCPANIGPLDMDAGECGATATWTEPTATDNCSASISRSDATGLNSGDLFPEGGTTIEYTATDPSGNTALCSFMVTVNPDAEPPTFSNCPGDISVNTDPDRCNAVVTWAEPTATDNCDPSPFVYRSGSPSGTSLPPGSWVVEYRALEYGDLYGNYGSCLFYITVTDMEPPTFTNCPANIGPLAMDAGECGATATWTEPTADDNCSANVTRIDATGLANGALFPEGATTIRYRATDPSGNYSDCSFTVTVEGDMEDPAIPDCPANIGPLDMDAGQCGATVTWTEPTATDNCSASISRSDATGLNSGDLFPEGATTIEYTATDPSGNTALCSFTVTVEGDMEDPAIPDCPANIGPLGMDAGECGATVTWTEPTATDNCSASIEQTTGLANGNLFPEGETTIEYTATDPSGNTAFCSFTVTVNPDAEPPTISNCPPNISSCSPTPTWTPPSAGDNCPDVVTLTPSANPSDVFPVGTTTVTYTATDAAGNTAECSFDVTVSQLTVTFSSSDYNGFNISCFGATDGETTAQVADGLTPYIYAWSDGQTTATATGLAAGTYTVTVSDTNGCEATASATLAQPDAVTASASVTSDYNGAQISCFGASDGEAAALGGGGTGNLGYAWSDGQTTATATGLAAGTYTVTVSDTNGCEATASATLAQPDAVTASASVTSDYNGAQISCFGASDGEAAALGGGGTGNLGYAWSDGQTTATATGLPSGLYGVTVTDTNGCTATSGVIMLNPLPVTITSVLQTADVSCDDGSNGGAAVTASGGTGGLGYLWGDGQTTATATGLSADSHTVTVTDANGCLATGGVTIAPPTPPDFEADVLTDFNGFGVSCNGAADGEAGVTVNDGGTYTFAWSDGQSTATATGLGAGGYTVVVSGSGGCSGTASVGVSQPAPLGCSASGSGPGCAGDANGELEASANGGAGGYTFDWNGPGGPYSGQTVTGLGAGTYNLTVTDANGCTCTDTHIIANPDPLGSPQLLGSVNGYEGGSSGSPYHYNTHQITVGGGSRPYSFEWDNSGYVRFSVLNDPDSDSTLVNIIYADGASWSLTVTDANGCGTGPDGDLVFDNNVVEENTLLDIESYAITADSGAGTGAIDITPTGGDTGCGVYLYQWTSALDPAFSESTQDVAGLASGWYVVVVTDCSGGTTVGTYWMPKSSGGSASGGFSRNKVAVGGHVGMNISPNPAGTHTTVSFGSLEAGNFTLEVFAVDGGKVATLFDGHADGGLTYSFDLDASGLPAGVYVCRLTRGDGLSVHEKISILK